MNKAAKVILYGGTGQAKVVRPILESDGHKVIAVVDDTPNLEPPFTGVELISGKNAFVRWRKKNPEDGYGFSITIGNPHGVVRNKLHGKLVESGLAPVTAIHETAWIAKSSTIGKGSQILAGAIVGELVSLGQDCIINTKASVDHECRLSDGVEIGPGATVCGLVKVGTGAWIAAGAVVLPRIIVGRNAIVGAGAVVTKNVPNGEIVVGVPAKSQRRSSVK